MSAGSSADSSCHSVLAELRRATAVQHRELEALLPLDERLTLSSYRQVIRGFDTFLSAWEPCLRQALPEGLVPWVASRSRHALLRQDLRALGLAAAVPPPAALAELQLAGLAGAFGSLYVMEGSMLGGQVIAPRLARQLALGPGNGAAYLAGWGSHAGSMWREFCQRMELEVGTCPLARAQACTAATQTFTALAAIFKRVLRDAAPA